MSPYRAKSSRDLPALRCELGKAGRKTLPDKIEPCQPANAELTLVRSALGVIADSPSLPRTALSSAIQVAQRLGAQLRVIRTNELEKPEYANNPLNRCYFCKHELFDRMQRLALDEGFPVLAYGENADDALELRPGAKAATEFKIKSPLVKPV